MTGRSWLKKRGLKIPKDAWVPDSFGFHQDMPDLLYFLGFRSEAIKSKWIYPNTKTSETNNRKRFC